MDAAANTILGFEDLPRLQNFVKLESSLIVTTVRVYARYSRAVCKCFLTYHLVIQGASIILPSM